MVKTIVKKFHDCQICQNFKIVIYLKIAKTVHNFKVARIYTITGANTITCLKPEQGLTSQQDSTRPSAFGMVDPVMETQKLWNPKILKTFEGYAGETGDEDEEGEDRDKREEGNEREEGEDHQTCF